MAVYKKSHESSLKDEFNKHMHLRAQTIQAEYIHKSLDGQDEEYSDYVISSGWKYCLVEFKWDKTKTENRKPLRLKLCEELEDYKTGADENNMFSLHKECHLITYLNIDSIVTNIYCEEICNKWVFADENANGKLMTELPNNELRKNFGEFADMFFTGQIGLDLDSFNNYLEWLASLSDDGNSSDEKEVEVIAFNFESNKLILKVFSNIGDAFEYTSNQYGNSGNNENKPKFPKP